MAVYEFRCLANSGYETNLGPVCSSLQHTPWINWTCGAFISCWRRWDNADETNQERWSRSLTWAAGLRDKVSAAIFTAITGAWVTGGILHLQFRYSAGTHSRVPTLLQQPWIHFENVYLRTLASSVTESLASSGRNVYLHWHHGKICSLLQTPDLWPGSALISESKWVG